MKNENIERKLVPEIGKIVLNDRNLIKIFRGKGIHYERRIGHIEIKIAKETLERWKILEEKK